MKIFRIILLLGFLPLIARSQSNERILRFDSDGFSINAEGFGVKRQDLGGVAGQSPTVVLYLTPTGGFAPNVNVLIQNFPASINDYITVTKKEFDSAGVKLLNEHLVSAEEWDLEYQGNLSGKEFHWYARAVKSGDKVYLTTATATPSQWDQVSHQLIQCVDSFALIGASQSQPNNLQPQPAS